MKILIFNQDWFATEFRELGHQVITCGWEPHLDHRIPAMTSTLTGVLSQLKGFEPDVIIWHDNSIPTILLAGLESTDIPTVFYSVDTFHHDSMHAFMAEIFDHILVAQKDYVPVFDGSTTPKTWLPLWAPRYVEACHEKKWKATFVGTLNHELNPRRVAFFDAIKDRIPIHIAQGNYWEYFPFAEIVLNQTVKGDLNFRVFEAMMSGALLLTERTPNGLSDLFQEGQHLITYTPDSVDEAVEKVTFLLQHPEQMRAIARAGREEVLKNHTAMSRALVVNKIITNLKKRSPAKDRHFRAMVNHTVTALFMHRQVGRYPPQALIAALAAAENGLLANDHLSDTHASYLVRACLVFDAVVGSNKGAELLFKCAEAVPRNDIVILAAIRTLLNTGKRLEAEVIASKISSSPAHEVFHFAEQTVQSIIEQVT